jgi:uracil-DNA glycosylase
MSLEQIPSEPKKTNALCETCPSKELGFKCKNDVVIQNINTDLAQTSLLFVREYPDPDELDTGQVFNKTTIGVFKKIEQGFNSRFNLSESQNFYKFTSIVKCYPINNNGTYIPLNKKALKHCMESFYQELAGMPNLNTIVFLGKSAGDIFKLDPDKSASKIEINKKCYAGYCFLNTMEEVLSIDDKELKKNFRHIILKSMIGSYMVLKELI